MPTDGKEIGSQIAYNKVQRLYYGVKKRHQEAVMSVFAYLRVFQMGPGGPVPVDS